MFNRGQIGDLAFISVFDLQPPDMHLKRACLTLEMGKGHWLQPEGLDISPAFLVLQDKKINVKYNCPLTISHCSIWRKSYPVTFLQALLQDIAMLHLFLVFTYTVG